jgi:hypothetical protein
MIHLLILLLSFIFLLIGLFGEPTQAMFIVVCSLAIYLSLSKMVNRILSEMIMHKNFKVIEVKNVSSSPDALSKLIKEYYELSQITKEEENKK